MPILLHSNKHTTSCITSIDFFVEMSLSLKGDEADFFSINTAEDDKFNTIIGSIEDLLVTEKFLQLQKDFFEKYWHEFEDNEENKLVYMDIFEDYQNTIEQYIDEYLCENVDGFNMDHFTQDLLTRNQEDLDGEIFEMLSTFTDFQRFKELFLDYKYMKEGKTDDLCNNISITNLSSLYEKNA